MFAPNSSMCVQALVEYETRARISSVIDGLTWDESWKRITLLNVPNGLLSNNSSTGGIF